MLGDVGNLQQRQKLWGGSVQISEISPHIRWTLMLVGTAPSGCREKPHGYKMSSPFPQTFKTVSQSVSGKTHVFNMIFKSGFVAVVIAGLAAAKTYPPDAVDKLTADSLPKLREWLAKNRQGNCTLETAVRRKEW